MVYIVANIAVFDVVIVGGVAVTMKERRISWKDRVVLSVIVESFSAPKHCVTVSLITIATEAYDMEPYHMKPTIVQPIIVYHFNTI